MSSHCIPTMGVRAVPRHFISSSPQLCARGGPCPRKESRESGSKAPRPQLHGLAVRRKANIHAYVRLTPNLRLLINRDIIKSNCSPSTSWKPGKMKREEANKRVGLGRKEEGGARAGGKPDWPGENNQGKARFQAEHFSLF